MKSNCRFSVYFFFFKQKTAYEMRISDWSSDVCSSDLPAGGRVDRKGLHDGQYRGPRPAQREGGVRTGRCTRGLEHFPGAGGCARRVGRLRQRCAVPCGDGRRGACARRRRDRRLWLDGSQAAREARGTRDPVADQGFLPHQRHLPRVPDDAALLGRADPWRRFCGGRGMTPVHAIASVLLVGMGYSVWRGFNPRKSEKPGPHNGWKNQDGAKKRSEEHTSELQSLMRISYAVFCLKKKKENE